MCNKICGKAHYKMKMDIEVLSKAEYAAWLAGKKKETFKLKYGTASAEGGDDMAKEDGSNSGEDMPAEDTTGEAAPIKKEDEI
jgi:heme/copper-type cytochrome/quinol oxidase subunit 2